MISGNSRPGALSLVDVVVIIVMALIMAAVLLRALPGARYSANEIECRSNLRQLGIALGDCEAQIGCLPRPAGTEAAQGISVLGQLLPWCEADPKIGKDSEIRILICPSDQGFNRATGGTSYGVNIRGWNHYGTSGEDFRALAQIPAGSSNVVAAGDIGQAGTYLWAAPNTSIGTTSEGEYNGCYGARLTTTTKTGPGSNVLAEDGSNVPAPLFSSFHTGGAVNLVRFDGHVVQANMQGSLGAGSQNGTGVMGGCHPAIGNASGIWWSERNTLWWTPIALWGAVAGGIVALRVIIGKALSRRRSRALTEAGSGRGSV